MTLSRVACGAFLSLFAALAACSSSTTSTPDTTPATTPDKGVDTGSSGGSTTPTMDQGTEINPYGKPYPTKNLGYTARAGSRAGAIMRNYKFLGYKDGDTSKTQVISLADFYDPEMKTTKLIHFTAAALWCNPCNQETDEIVGLEKTAKPEKVTVIQAIIEGQAEGTGSTLPDLAVWQKRHSTDYSLFLDPEQGNLGQFFEAAAIPWNAYLDARSMEILQSGVGFAAGENAKTYQTWLTWIDANAAQAVQ